MTIKFYDVKDDRRCTVKTLNSANLKATLTGNIKTDTSIIDPVFEVAYDADIMVSNYMRIDALHRYYFINNIEVGAQRLYIHAHVDVLMSYHTDIDKLQCVVARQASKFKSNLYLGDEMFKSILPKDVVSLPFPSAMDDTGSYVLAIGGES
ncbi:MAG: hypothetical protein IIY21_21160 [Clostridiales bacterium]|nr:hypothetical protein [Clostridiales bacterium]MBQ1571638.1 hypothetical protein [Clostridiales bacterium]